MLSRRRTRSMPAPWRTGAAQLGALHHTRRRPKLRWTKQLYRYQAAVRTHLSVTPYDDAAEQLVSSTVLEAAETMSDPADLINRAIEALEVRGHRSAGVQHARPAGESASCRSPWADVRSGRGTPCDTTLRAVLDACWSSRPTARRPASIA